MIKINKFSCSLVSKFILNIHSQKGKKKNGDDNSNMNLPRFQVSRPAVYIPQVPACGCQKTVLAF